jgi:hypothetical protein
MFRAATRMLLKLSEYFRAEIFGHFGYRVEIPRRPPA